MSSPLERLWHKMGQAIHDYRLIDDGDMVAVGLSGGKDSLLLTYALSRFKRVAPIHFDLMALTIDGGFDGGDPKQDADGLAAFCGDLGIRHVRHSVPIWQAIREQGAVPNPCSLCSRLRRGALNRIAAELGCGKLALAHHADDAVETLMMNIFLNGRIDCFSPKSHMSRAGITLIRPMVYVQEDAIRQLAVDMGLPVAKNPCPANGHTKRQEAKDFLAKMAESSPGARERALAALHGDGGPWRKMLQRDADQSR